MVDAILDFINGEQKHFYIKRVCLDEVNSCLAVECYDYYELNLRAQSIHEFRRINVLGSSQSI